MTTRSFFEQAAGRADDLINRISADDWEKPTPCSDWDVRALVRHMVYETLWLPDLLAGKKVAEVGDKYEGDVLGDDPRAAWVNAKVAALTAVSEPKVLARQVHLSYGDVSGEHYVFEISTDLSIHSWDLAKGLGVTPKLDQATALAIYDRYAPQAEALHASGLFGTQIKTKPSADIVTRLLALYGRRADWSN